MLPYELQVVKRLLHSKAAWPVNGQALLDGTKLPVLVVKSHKADAWSVQFAAIGAATEVWEGADGDNLPQRTQRVRTALILGPPGHDVVSDYLPTQTAAARKPFLEISH